MGCRSALLAILLIAGNGAPTSHALALNSCLSEALGEWRGPVLNGLGIEQMTSSFFLTSDGTLAGMYRIEDAVPFDGALTDFRQTSACAGDFTWHDRDGSGIVHIDFEPGLGRFIGRWGPDEPAPGNVFNGFRHVSPTS